MPPHPFSSKQLRCPLSWAIKKTVASDQKCNILKYEHHFSFRLPTCFCIQFARIRSVVLVAVPVVAVAVGVVQYLQPDGGDEENVAKLNKTCDNRQATMSWLVAGSWKPHPVMLLLLRLLTLMLPLQTRRRLNDPGDYRCRQSRELS